MWSDQTAFFVWDDWSGYGYSWTYDYTYDDDAANVGETDIVYQVQAWGYRCDGGGSSGYDAVTVHPEDPYAWGLHLEGYYDRTLDLASSFCTSCSSYAGKWWLWLRYQPIDQWGVDFQGAWRFDEDIDSNNPASGSNCGDSFQTGGADNVGAGYDSWKGCLNYCPFDPNCTGTFWQGIYLNQVHLGDNLDEFDCSFGYVDHSPFIW